jgi:glycosyltransferase involved in cell wall biosynthesis
MNPVKVAYDREIFLFQEYGGVSKYFSRIITEFLNVQSLGIEPALTFQKSKNFYLNEQFPELLTPPRFFFQPKGGLGTLLTLGPTRSLLSRWSGGKSKTSKADIFHATYYRPTVYEIPKGSKVAVTIHDFIPEKLGWTGVRNPHIGKKSLCKRADLIFCISNVTAVDLMERYGVSETKIKVIHHGFDLKKAPALEVEGRDNGPPTILYIGHRGGYKNFQVLVEALRNSNSKGVGLRLVTVGPDLIKSEVDQYSDLLSNGSWIHRGNVSDDELDRLYQGATLHCVTSLMEGFGMTILESMSFGTPVILSDIPIFREVAGAAGIYFDPSDSDDLLCKVIDSLQPMELVKSRQKVYEHVSGRDWTHVATKYAEAYRNLL